MKCWQYPIYFTAHLIFQVICLLSTFHPKNNNLGPTFFLSHLILICRFVPYFGSHVLLNMYFFVAHLVKFFFYIPINYLRHQGAQYLVCLL